MSDLPDAVLFACGQNAIRSPMAAAIMRHLFGHLVYVDSVGVRGREIDGFVIAVMDEIGIDLGNHEPKTFEELEDTSFDLIVSLSPEAQHRAVEMTRTMACEVEFWNTFDPSVVEGGRETILDAYRQVRDGLRARIINRFRQTPAPQV